MDTNKMYIISLKLAFLTDTFNYSRIEISKIGVFTFFKNTRIFHNYIKKKKNLKPI